MPDTRTPAQYENEIRLLDDAMRFVPNDDLHWADWNKVGLALQATTRGSKLGRDLFHAFSEQSSKYNKEETEARWQAICRSPPDRIGANFLFRLARENDWTTIRLPPITKKAIPKPQPNKGNGADAARKKITETIDKFFRFIEHPDEWRAYLRFLEQEFGFGFDYTLVHAMQVSTGSGKTQKVIKKIARTRKKILYTVPRLELADRIEQQFRALGVSVAVFRGRDADDPNHPGEKMCLDPEAVEVALKAHLDVSRTCCKRKDFECAFFDRCGYQAQKEQRPQVWIAASNILFHEQNIRFHGQKKVDKPDVVIIDELMWTSALVGIKHEEMITVPLAAFERYDVRQEKRRDEDGIKRTVSIIGLTHDSSNLHNIASHLKSQPEDGGLQKRYLHEEGWYDPLNDEIVHRAIKEQWAKIDRIQKKLNFYPGLSQYGRKKLDKRLLDELTLAHEKKQICEELRTLLKRPRIETSGRLLLDHHKGQRVIRWRGAQEINRQFRVPTLLLDATLPDPKILRVLHPDVEVVAKVDVALPESVFVRQVLSAPVSDSKLSSKNAGKQETNEKKRRSIRRYILKRWIETGRQATLVICQQDFEEWLHGKLPKEIRLEQYNDVAGLDDHRDVRLMILIGRTQPGPEAPEALAGALSGAMPKPAMHRNPVTGFVWYTPEQRFITLKNGTGVPVFGDLHPDPLSEKIRWQICERELVQAFGRARAINRDKDHPLDVEMLFNTVTPITVDDVTEWNDPSLWWETIAEGVMLTSRVDLMKVWPDHWPNVDKAKQTVSETLPVLPGLTKVTYQLVGPKMKPRTGYFDFNLIPDPRGWLEGRLGLLALYEADRSATPVVEPL